MRFQVSKPLRLIPTSASGYMVLDSICNERRDLDNCSIDSLSHVYGRRNKPRKWWVHLKMVVRETPNTMRGKTVMFLPKIELD